MGDDGRLYVKEAVAEAIRGPARSRRRRRRAKRLGARPVKRVSRSRRPPGAIDACAADWSSRVLVSSIRRDGEIGALYVEGDDAWFAAHAAAPSAPKGAGDLLTVLFAAALLGGFLSGPDALGLAVGGVDDAVDEAGGLEELPLTGFPTMLAASRFVSLEPIDEWTFRSAACARRVSPPCAPRSKPNFASRPGTRRAASPWPSTARSWST